MTIEEVKNEFGDKNEGYYISCIYCPLHLSDYFCGCNTGFEDCWEAIAVHMTQKETEYDSDEEKNPYWERICELANYQRSKGIGKYGKGLEDNPAAMIARIQHLQEELIDGLMYCEWIKDKLRETEGENK